MAGFFEIERLFNITVFGIVLILSLVISIRLKGGVNTWRFISLGIFYFLVSEIFGLSEEGPLLVFQNILLVLCVLFLFFAALSFSNDTGFINSKLKDNMNDMYINLSGLFVFVLLGFLIPVLRLLSQDSLESILFASTIAKIALMMVFSLLTIFTLNKINKDMPLGIKENSDFNKRYIIVINFLTGAFICIFIWQLLSFISLFVDIPIEEFVVIFKTVFGLLFGYALIRINFMGIKSKIFRKLLIGGSIEKPKDNIKIYNLKPGNVYYHFNKDSDYSFEVFSDQVFHKSSGICFTNLNPLSIKKTYGLENTPIIIISEKKGAHPHFLHPKMLIKIQNTISSFILDKEPIDNESPYLFENEKVVLIQCMDELIKYNPKEKLLDFVNDLSRDVVGSHCVLILFFDTISFSQNDIKQFCSGLENLMAVHTNKMIDNLDENSFYKFAEYEEKYGRTFDYELMIRLIFRKMVSLWGISRAINFINNVPGIKINFSDQLKFSMELLGDKKIVAMGLLSQFEKEMGIASKVNMIKEILIIMNPDKDGNK